jgi:hypothetical protein
MFSFALSGKMLSTNQFIMHRKRIVVALVRANSRKNKGLWPYERSSRSSLTRGPFPGPRPNDHLDSETSSFSFFLLDSVENLPLPPTDVNDHSRIDPIHTPLQRKRTQPFAIRKPPALLLKKHGKTCAYMSCFIPISVRHRSLPFHRVYSLSSSLQSFPLCCRICPDRKAILTFQCVNVTLWNAV